MITYHHIGGRNGTFPVPVQKLIFSKEIHLILYDADVDCFGEMVKFEQDGFGKVSVYPYCIGEKTEEKFLNINFHPTTNSLYDFNEKYVNYSAIFNPLYGEYCCKDVCQLVRRVPVNTLSLMDAMKQANIQEIDFLSMDIQGAEYDVIYGSRSLIQGSCLGIQLEVEFAQIYKNQKSFAEVHQLLESLGFELIELNYAHRYTPNILPIGFKGLEQPLYGEATYIKKFSILALENSVERLCKWAIFNLIYGKIGLCLQALNILESLNISQEYQKLQYVSALKRIWKLYQSEKSYTYPKISELFDQEIIASYYRGIPNNAEIFSERNSKIREKIIKQYSHLSEKIVDLINGDYTEFELFLRQQGLFKVSEVVKENRIREAGYFINLMQSLSNPVAVDA